MNEQKLIDELHRIMNYYRICEIRRSRILREVKELINNGTHLSAQELENFVRKDKKIKEDVPKLIKVIQ